MGPTIRDKVKQSGLKTTKHTTDSRVIVMHEDHLTVQLDMFVLLASLVHYHCIAF